VQVADRIVQTTSRYMLGNLAISMVCGTVYGVTAVILDVPYPLALAVIAGILDLIPSIASSPDRRPRPSRAWASLRRRASTSRCSRPTSYAATSPSARNR
jgi:hypothetical protein